MSFRWLITGAGGMVGHDVVEALQTRNEDVIALPRSELDIADEDTVLRRVDQIRPDIIVNCAAYTRVDAAEKEEIHAYAKQKRTLADINLQDLSADDRRVLLQHAVLLCHVDGDFSAEESKFVDALSTHLKIPADEAKSVISHAAERAKANLKHL